ncbi:MT-A70 family methyltransferase [Polycladidibacter hongkongensis]|uniref:MT-A70 family methyltransferase n=1 Tax=Polycladidibacter hongkongensis TaxID=1647556 RepID=UPI000830C059|nr:MT-A70 family methyltransferase [Pseudovibrio hongkongensis]
MRAVFNQLSQIPPLSYDLIMADPPWSYANWSKKGEHKNASAKYDCMALDQIKDMNVSHLAAGDCVLWLWATNPLLREAFEVLDAWGFSFVTAGHWVKYTQSQRTKKRRLAFGTGYALRCAGEPFLIGKVGAPKFGSNVRSVIEGLRREHSRKPDEAYAAAEKLFPAAHRRLDLFSREQRVGWDCFGDETGKFDEVA